MTNFATGNTLQNVFLPPAGTQNTSKTGLVFARRTLSPTYQIIPPLTGQQMSSPYIPFKLSALKNGLSALSELKKLGFNYVSGTSFTEIVTAPDDIVVDVVTGLVALTWNSVTTGLENLASANPTGSVTQAVSLASATIKNVTVVGNTTVMTVIMVNASPDFDTVNDLTINVTLPFNAPDPKLSDEVCVFAFWFYQKYASSPTYTSSPDLWISTLIDGINTSISPQSTPISLVAPTTATLLADGSYNLTYALTAANLGLLPTAFFGSTVVTQGTETGTYNGYVIRGSTVTINVTNPSGAFDDSTVVSVALDVARNGGTLLVNTEIATVGMCFPVPNATVLNANHSDFTGLIASLRAPAQAKNNKFNVIGYYGYVPEFIGQYPLSYYTQPDTLAYCMTIKLDIPTIFQYPCNNVMIIAQSMFTDLNNDVSTGFQADVGEVALLNVTVSSNKASWGSESDYNLLVEQGCTPVAITEASLPYWFQRVTTYQTQSGNIDLEFRYMSLQLKVRWLDKNIEIANRRATIDSTTGQRRNNNPGTKSAVEVGGKLVLQNGADLGICGTIGNNVTVSLQTTDVTRILETVTTSIVPQNNGVDAVLYIQSYTG